jgi:hypothetical protein
MQGRIIHRHKQNMLLALMNTAPAELPHRLIDAAVQLFRLYETSETRIATTKKNAGSNAGVGIQLQKGQLLFQGKEALARHFRAHRRNRKSQVSVSSVHQVRQ